MALSPTLMTDQPDPNPDGGDGEESRDPNFLEAARRAKLARIIELGHDPWGTRFDDRQLIGEIRARASEIVYCKADGANITLPSLETEEERAAFRPWIAEQGAGEIVGPQVRAAG